MFQGSLRYDLVKIFQSNPTLGPLSLNDQFAEEAFTVYDHPKVLEFVRHWRSIAVLNYVEFSLSYELSYLLRSESRTLKSHPTSVTSAILHSPPPIDNRPGDVSPIGRAGSESGHRQDSRASKPRHDAGSTPASRS